MFGDGRIDKRLNQIHFGAVGGGDINREWNAVAVGKNHQLGALAAFGFAYAITPFFAEANVPSPKLSSQLSLPAASSL